LSEGQKEERNGNGVAIWDNEGFFFVWQRLTLHSGDLVLIVSHSINGWRLLVDRQGIPEL